MDGIGGVLRMEKRQVVIKLEKIPVIMREFYTIVPLKGLLIRCYDDDNIYVHQVVYKWFFGPDDLCIIRDLDGYGSTIGKADTLQKALRLALKDYTNLLELMPKARIKVIE